MNFRKIRIFKYKAIRWNFLDFVLIARNPFGKLRINNMLFTILFFTFLASIVSLLLVSMLLAKENVMRNISFSLVSFAAGALLATGFLDTMKEAVALDGKYAFLRIIIAFAAFFIIERLFIFM